MTAFGKFDEYELNEKNIDSMLNYLRIFDPESANPENAIDFLEFYHAAIHKIGHKATDEDLKKLYERFTSKKPLLRIVIPVYNEADNFPALYKMAKKHIKTPHEIIVIYDSPKDNTVPVVRKLAKKDKTLILHKNTLGNGFLNALKSGFDYVKSGPVLVVMGDLSDDLSIIDAMYEKYMEGAAVVCGSRHCKGGHQIEGPLIKRSLSKMAGISLYWLRHFPTHDVTNNFKLYDKDLLDSITIESEGGFEVAMEITVKAFHKHTQIAELPTTWHDRTAGKSNFKLLKYLPNYLHWYIYAFLPRNSASNPLRNAP